MSDTERGSASNLMYLCGSHHDSIDYQLHLHTVDFLRSAKQAHESAIARGVRAALGEVSFAHLTVVCQTLGILPIDETSIELPLEIAQKLQLNDLTEASADKVRDGLAQAGKVQAFIEFTSAYTPHFGPRLAASFKAAYFTAVAEGLVGDEIFDRVHATAVENSGPRDTIEIQAAALAVVAYLFSICEIFEHAAIAS